MLKRFAGYFFMAIIFLGIFLFGVFIGSHSSAGQTDEADLLNLARSDNRKLLDLIGGYEAITELYVNQEKNIGTIMNFDLYYSDPKTYNAALDDAGKYRDLINFQHGRIIELRHAAGLRDHAETY